MGATSSTSGRPLACLGPQHGHREILRRPVARIVWTAAALSESQTAKASFRASVVSLCPQLPIGHSWLTLACFADRLIIHESSRTI